MEVAHGMNKGYPTEKPAGKSAAGATRQKKSQENSHGVNDAITLSPFYYSAVNAVTRPNKFVAVSQYFIDRWMPLLGGNGTMIVLALRRDGFLDRRTGECRDEIVTNLASLAAAAGMSVDTLSRELGLDKKTGKPRNPWLHLFVQSRQRVRRDHLGRVRQEESAYWVAMDDPVHPDDWHLVAEAVLVAEARQDKPSPPVPQSTDPVRRPVPQFAAPVPQNAVPKPQSAVPEPQNADHLNLDSSDPSLPKQTQQQYASPEPYQSPQDVAPVVVEGSDDGDGKQVGPDESFSLLADGHNPVEANPDDDDTWKEDDPPSAQVPVPPAPIIIAGGATSPQEILLQELVSEGMGEGQAKMAVRDHYDMAVYQLANLRHALPGEKILPSNGGWLHLAVNRPYGPTKGYQQFLEVQKAEEKRQAATAKRQAATAEREAERLARNEVERVLFDEAEAELSCEEFAVLRQRARNCVPPELRQVSSAAKCTAMVQTNFEALLRGEKRKEYSFWAVPGLEDGGGDEGE